jgi:hypothetical protein
MDAAIPDALSQENLQDSLGALESKVDKANAAILGLHRDFCAINNIITEDLIKLDQRLKGRLKSSIGRPLAMDHVLVTNVWDVLAQLDTRVSEMSPPEGLDSNHPMMIDVQTRLGSLAIGLTSADHRMTSLKQEGEGMRSEIGGLSQGLTSSLQVILGLKQEVAEMRSRPAGHPSGDSQSDSRLLGAQQVDSLGSEVAAIRKQGTAVEQLSCFSDLLGGASSF